jgi:hypothetical protein
MQRAKEPFVILTDGMYRVVRRGEELEEDDPIVEANPNMHPHLPTSSGGPTTVEQPPLGRSASDELASGR